MKYTFSVLFFFLGISFLIAQDSIQYNDLLNKAEENMRLVTSDLEGGFEKAKSIEKEAQSIKAKEPELLALVGQCIYYKAKIDFENLRRVANNLFTKAKLYEMSDYQAIGKYYLFEAYLFNGLPDKAFIQLEEGMKYVQQASQEGKATVRMKNNYYIAYSNYYLENKDFENQLKYIKLSGDLVGEMPEGERKHELMYLYYSNLAQVYNEMNQVDSAKFYSLLSNSIDKGYNKGQVQFMNLMILGEASMKSEDYAEAISYFEKAEEIDASFNHINVLKLYDNMIEAYQKLNLTDSAQSYQYKKDLLNLNISENQNKFLRNLLDSENAKTNEIYLYLLLVIVVALGVFIYIGIRKKKILLAQEKVSEQYLENNQKIAKDHHRLIDLVKENNLAFMKYFEEVYPDFIPKLQEINPKISHSDAEFCALLKLRMPTKEIAQCKFIAPKTVQNKRHLIRKKLNIPKDMDTYQWFEDF